MTSGPSALQRRIARTSKTLEHIKGAWVASREVGVEDGQVSEYRVLLKVTFILK